MNRPLLQSQKQLKRWATRGFMSGMPPQPSKSRTRDALEVLAAGVVAVTLGTYLTVRVTENKRKIAMDALQDSGLRIDKMSPVPSSSKTAPVTETRDVPASQRNEDGGDKVDTSEDDVPNTGEASSELEGGGGAFNPVTGEINWDCPCLGGMAHGPCGLEFREAFSCFVYSEDEPKGINCVEKFKSMQDCFRRHPEEYAEEIADDDEQPAEGLDDPELSNPAPVVQSETEEPSQSSEQSDAVQP